MVRESSDKGCPLQAIWKDLYQPKGTRTTGSPLSSSLDSKSRSIPLANFGAPKEELKWA